jgi:hypothetical protein
MKFIKLYFLRSLTLSNQVGNLDKQHFRTYKVFTVPVSKMA